MPGRGIDFDESFAPVARLELSDLWSQEEVVMLHNQTDPLILINQQSLPLRKALYGIKAAAESLSTNELSKVLISSVLLKSDWMSKKSDCTAMHQQEAEYVGVISSVLNNVDATLLKIMHNLQKNPLYCDSQSP
ncbi:hypothetical protein Tco_1131451 [Tanacetum coccineum]